MADPVTAPTTKISNSKGTSGGTAAQRSQVSLGNDFADFIKLLTIQLQNQDPTAPLDANQFTNQIVSFSQVQQQVNMNTNLEKLISLTQTNQLSNASSYIGKSVEVDGSSATLVNGQAKFTYNLDANAHKTVMTISDSTGNIVYSGEGETSKGKHIFTWDGRSDEGDLLPPGNYKIDVAAYDENQNDITTSTTSKGVVTGVSMQNGAPMLHIGDTIVSLDKILSVEEETSSAS